MEGEEAGGVRSAADQAAVGRAVDAEPVEGEERAGAAAEDARGQEGAKGRAEAARQPLVTGRGVRGDHLRVREVGSLHAERPKQPVAHVIDVRPARDGRDQGAEDEVADVRVRRPLAG